MTPLQIILLLFIFIVFAMIGMALFEILDCIDDGEYKKALIAAIFAVILTIIVFAAILVAF